MKKVLGCFGWLMVIIVGIALLILAAPLALAISVFAWWYFNKKGNEKYVTAAKLSTVISALGTVFFIYAINNPTEPEIATTPVEQSSSLEQVDKQPEEPEIEAEETQVISEAETEAETDPEEEPIEESIEEAEFNPNDYNPELTYEDLARNPDENLLKRVTFEGKIIQVMQGDESSQYRLAANGDYNNVFLLEISNDKLDQRILDDDYIRFYGMFMGEITYESALGGNITVPGVLVDEFEFK